MTHRAIALEGRPLASFWSRFIAYLIDFLIISVIYAPIEGFVKYFWQKYKGLPIEIHVHVDYHNPGALIAIVIYFALAVYWTNGKTIGKWLTKIRVVSLVHERITLWQAVERALGYGASALEFGFGFLQVFFHHNRCCVHDRIAETIVVNDRPLS